MLRNVSGDHPRWVELKLIGASKSTRDGVGASIRLQAGGMTQREDIFSGGSFLSSNDQRAHFGLRGAHSVDRVTIHWSSGRIEAVAVQT